MLASPELGHIAHLLLLRSATHLVYVVLHKLGVTVGSARR